MRRRGSKNRREERAFPQFRDAELQVAGLGRQRLRAMPVALIHTRVDTFIAAGTDCFGGFGLDQLLEHPAGDLADQVGAFADADRVEQVGQVRIGQSHRCVLLDVVLAGTHQESRRWLTDRWTSQTHHPAGLYQVLVRVIGRMYQVLGLRLTQRKLAQTVPFVGVGINAALSANMTRHAYQRAEDVYRLRFLTEKYGLDPQTWLRGISGVNDDLESQSEQLDIVQMLDEEIQPDE